MSGAEQSTLLRINCAGYKGKAASVFCAIDRGTGVLAVARESDLELTDRNGFLRVSNVTRDEFVDLLFTEESLRDAIAAYFELQSLGLLRISERVGRISPDSRIERDGVDERGTKYRLSSDISSGQVAVLIASWVAKSQRDAESALEFADDLLDLLTI